MREIKFRAWLDYGNGEGEMLPNIQNHINGKWAFGHIANGSVDGVSQPMQYTGIKDKNGVEIYEGDLIVDRDREKPATVEYREDNCCFMLSSNSFVTKECVNRFQYEVIGNIHQNPELLD